jgi:dihydroorotate dehydrogenase
LEFAKPILNSAGSLGFAPDPRAPLDWREFGAFITNPVSMRPRLAAEEPALIEFPGGFLLHTGLPNPGLRQVLRDHGRSWAQSALPIIVHLVADRPEETKEMVQALESTENVLAVELGFAPLLSDDLISLAVEMSSGELPLIVSLSAEQLLRLGPRVLERGAVALSIAAPRGVLARDSTVINGRLFGPALLPATMALVQNASKISLPVIGSGGVFSKEAAATLLTLGALAVQMDMALWLPSGNKKGLVS